MIAKQYKRTNQFSVKTLTFMQTRENEQRNAIFKKTPVITSGVLK